MRPAETEASVSLAAVDNDIADGDRTVTVTASGEGFDADATATVDVLDDEVPTLTVSIDPAIISENGGTATVTVTRNTDPFVNLTVNLSSDDTSEATVPATVSFGAEQTSATVLLTAVDDLIADGDPDRHHHRTSFTDSTTPPARSTSPMTRSPPSPSRSGSASISENGGTTTVTVTRNTDPAFAESVDISSDDPSGTDRSGHR